MAESMPKTRDTRFRNWPLDVGLVLVLLVGIAALLGPSLSPRDPLATNTVARVGDQWIPPPYPPFTVPGFPLGSDTFGRDLLSRLLWGIRPTMLLVTIVALLRLLMGVVVGMAAGWSTGRTGRVLEGVISAALAVPAIIVSLAVITAVGIQRGLLAFVLGLTATGWADTARLVSEQTRALREQPYAAAARAMGASGIEIAVRHVLRQVAPLLGMLLAFEAGSTLMVIAGLGFLGYYLGGAFWIETTDFAARAVSGLPELGQMLANSWQIFKPWATVAAGTVVFAAILGFNLVGEGLRRRSGTALMGRRGALSEVNRRIVSWVEETLLVPDREMARRRRALAWCGVALLVVAGSLIWRPWEGRAGELDLVTAPIALPIAGNHLWAAERRDAYGTLTSFEVEPVDPIMRWALPDESGFPGGPVLDAAGGIYIASAAGTVYALTPSGELRWYAGLPSGAVSSPALGPPSRPQDSGTLYVADRAGGLSAYSLEGEFIWRIQSTTNRRASSGPVVATDGTIYYTVVDRVEAVSPQGTSLWTSVRLPGQGEITPRLALEQDWLFVRDAVLERADGRLVDLSAIVQVGQAGVNAFYVIGGDGKSYLLEEHAMFAWEMAPEGARRTRQLGWNYRAATLYLPFDGGVSAQGSAWLLYGSAWDDLRWIMLGADGRLKTNLRYPQRLSRVIAVDAADRAYICGAIRAGQPDCIAVVPGEDEPGWQIALDRSKGNVVGGALAPGRLYVATDDGWLYAIGDE